MKKYLLSTFAIVALLCVACGGGGDDAPTTVPVSGIKLDKSSLSLEIGEKATVTATIAPSDATNKSITWSSANQTIATVSNGVVTGVATGETTITAKTNDGGFTATIPVKVTLPAVKVSEIKIGPENATIEVGETKQFAAAISPADASDKTLEWSSSNTSVATVTSNGFVATVTAVSKGTATITATAKDGSGVKASTTVTVTGPIPTRITFDGATTYEFDSWQGKVIDFKKDLKMKVEPADADLDWIDWGISIQSARPDVSGEEVKFEVKDDNVTLSYAHSSHWVAKETVEITATVNGSELASASINFTNRGVLFYSATNACFYDLAMYGNKMNWDNKNFTKLRFICFNKVVGTGSNPSYDNYKIPASEYTLTSSDESKIKVTKNDDGISWMVERLNTTDLAAVTLTYKCGEHTQTYTINLIP